MLTEVRYDIVKQKKDSNKKRNIEEKRVSTSKKI